MNNLLHGRFKKVAKKIPSKTAIIFQGKQISYKDLDSRSNFLAKLLLQLGIKKEDFVVVFMDKNIDMVSSFLGILKAGGTYIPIDTGVPPKRLARIIEKSKPKLILSQKKCASKLKIFSNSHVIFLESIKFPTDYQKSPLLKIDENQLAYIIFTSGTTGEPKGVMIEHASVTNTIVSLIDKYYISEKSRLLQFSSVSFDSSVAEIFSVLSVGGTLILAKDSDLKNLAKLEDIIEKLKITTISLPPALLNYLHFDKNDYINTVISAGEKCPVHLANRLFKEVPHFINAYGPTECSICVTTYEVHSQLEKDVPIGKPLPNTTIFLLDESMKVVPKGGEGEICVSGVGLSRGYLNDKKATESNFVQSPFNPDEILYKTNDEAFVSADGNYVFLGRKDFQVKIRGNRVELEEIERAISGFKDIINNAVILTKNSRNEPILNCYYTSEKPIDNTSLRNYLFNSLPIYMTPNNFIYLQEMPVSTNGKIDRDKLQSISIPTKQNLHYLKTESVNEALMKKIFKKILRAKKIDINDNFFDLGGESLLAMRLVSEINSEFNTDIDVVSIFEHPILSDLVKYIEGKIKTPQKKLSTPKNNNDFFPLSNIQKMFWFAYKTKASSPVNNITTVIDLKGEVDTKVLRKSLHEMLGKHILLGSNFIEGSNGPVQKINNFLNINLNEINVKTQKKFDEKILKISSKPFILETDPLIRVTIFKFNLKHSKLAIVVPHIIADAESMEILIKDLFETYNKYLGKTFREIEPPENFYREYVHIEKTDLKTKNLARMKKFWTNYLDKATGFIDLPTDLPKFQQKKSDEGRIYNFQLSRKKSSQLFKLARKLRITPYILLISIFNIFIHKISNQDDIVIGTPVSIRPLKKFENTFGPFINTIVLRSTIKRDIRFTDYIGLQKKNILEILRNKEYPFNKLVEELNIARSYEFNPLFNVMFDYFKESKILNISGIPIERELSDNHTSKFDLTFSVLERSHGKFNIGIEYRTSLFNESTIKRFADNFLFLLNSLLVNYRKKISLLPVLNNSERDMILKSFNNTDFQFSKKSFIEIFEEQVEKFPYNIAIKYGDSYLTYEALNKKSNMLARHLTSLGVGRNVSVGVLLERSPDLVITILAIWKACGVYVPLETEYPKARIEEMVLGSKSVLIVSKKKYKDLLPSKIPVLNLEDENAFVSDDANLEVNPDPMSIAYVIFTSGSTQKPKGAMIRHAGMMNHLFIMIDYLRLSSNSRIAQNASHCFDISVWQLVCALLVGGTTVIYSKEVVLDPPEFLKSVDNDGIEILEIVPSFLELLVDLVENKKVTQYSLKNLKYLLPTGEVVKPKLMRRWFLLFPKIKAINAYGPAEASDDTNFYPMNKAPDENMVSIPIGKPLKNIRTYILDKHLNLCPIGVFGEICISGVAVAAGYINNPTKTKESFIHDPFSPLKTNKLYRTGDLGRWLPDGNIEFAGRKDLQVKIHGFRIELEEIENTLSEYGGIKEVVVKDWQDKKNEQSNFLAAYYTSNFRIPFSRLREFLLGKLPYFMVPKFFIKLDKMPLNNSGKINRKALEYPEPEKLQATRNHLSEKEKIIIDTWQEVLKKKSIKPEDNFFELGGDSIQSIQITSILKEKGINLDVKDIFLYQSPKELSNHIIDKSQTILRKSKKGRFAFTPVQTDFFKRKISNKNYYFQGFWFDLAGKIDVKALSESFTSLLLRHDSLRLRFEGKYQEFSNDPQEAFSFYDLSKSRHPENEKKVIADKICHELDIKKGRVSRSALFKLSKSFKLLIIVHHLAIDYFSWNLLIQDLENIYFSIVNKQEITPLGPSSSYKDWAEALEKYSRENEIKKFIPFWEDICQEIKTIFLPKTPVAPNKIKKQVVLLRINDNIAKSISTFKISQKKSTQSILVLAVTRALRDFSKRDKISISIENYGRTNIFKDIDINSTVGWFSTSFPVTIRISKDKTLIQNLNSCDATLNKVPDNGISFGLIKYLRNKTDSDIIRVAPDTQVVFNYLGDLSSISSGRLIKDPEIIPEGVNEWPESLKGQIEIDFYFKKNKLFLEIRYLNNTYDEKQIRELQTKILKYLMKLLEMSQITNGKIPKFDLVQLGEERYKRIYERFK